MAGGMLAVCAAATQEQREAGGGDVRCCPVVELRQYTLHPNRFDRFLRLFERAFIEPQEAAGMTVIGQFRDLDDPNRFVWLRGFPDMPTRARALETFYGGALWKSLRDEANDNFIDTDNVLLLKSPGNAAQFRLAGLQRAALDAPAKPAGFVFATIYSLDPQGAAAFADYFETQVRPALAQAHMAPLAWFETDPTPNNFPRLPVREGEQVFIWIATFVNREQGEQALRTLSELPRWRESIAPELARRSKAASQVLRLEPTPRSLLRG